MNVVAAISSLCLILCGLPELIRGLQIKHVGASWGLLMLWFIGEVLGLIYTLYLGNLPLICNYGFNTVIVGCLIYLKWRENGK